MKFIFVTLIFLFLGSGSLFAQDNWLPDDVLYEGEIFQRDDGWKNYEQTAYEDLDGDGQKEIIVRFRVKNERPNPTAFTAIYKEQNGKKVLVKSILGGEIPKKMDLIDIDKDGLKDLVLYDHAGNHYTLIMIYSYKNNEYTNIFKNGTPCYLYEVVTNAKLPQIIIGRENWDDPEFSYANSDKKSLKEVYAWNGESFKYSSELSTTPFIGEKQALEATWQNTLKNIAKIDDIESNPRWDEFVTEYTIKGWNGGSRAFELFKDERDEIVARRKRNYERFKKDAIERFNLINAKLEQELANIERAELLSERALIMLTAFNDVDALRIGTSSLLEAIKLAPNKKWYKEFLVKVYDRLWYKKDFSDNDDTSRQFSAFRDRIMILANAYRISKK